jgi:hypothetical protein
MITKEEYEEANELAEQIGAMLWRELDNLNRSLKGK